MRFFKDQVVNAICLFTIVFTFCLMLSIVLKCYFEKDIDVTFVKDIFSIGATAYVGLLGVALYSDWRKQKRYELKKQYAQEILDHIFRLKHYLHTSYHQLTLMKIADQLGQKIENKLNSNDFDLLGTQSLVYSKIEAMNLILFHNFTNHLIIESQDFKDKILFLIFSLNLVKQLPIAEQDIKIPMIVSNPTNTKDEYTVHESKKMFDDACDQLISNLINIMKI